MPTITPQTLKFLEDFPGAPIKFKGDPKQFIRKPGATGFNFLEHIKDQPALADLTKRGIVTAPFVELEESLRGQFEFPGQPAPSPAPTPAPTPSPIPTPAPTPIDPTPDKFDRTLVDIATSRPKVLATARAQGGDPFTAGTPANKWLNDWWNTSGKQEFPGVTLIQPEEVQRGDKSIEEFAEAVDAGEADESTAIGTSAEARVRARELGIDLPEQPGALDLFTTGDQTKLTAAQQDRADIQEETAGILNERLKIGEEFQKFQDEQVGLPEAGRVGAVAEKGKELQRRLDVLNRRELVLETKLQNRNTVISELMSAKRQEYEDAVQTYNTRFSQALQLYNIFDRKDTELQRNAQASLDVLIEAFSGQIQAEQATLEEVMGAHGTKLEELELQAGLPKGSTRELLKSQSSSQEGFEYKGTIGSSTTGYKALWINPETGESRLDPLTGGTPTPGTQGLGQFFEGKTIGEGIVAAKDSGFGRASITNFLARRTKMTQTEREDALDRAFKEEDQFLDKEYFKRLFGEEELKKAAAAAGFKESRRFLPDIGVKVDVEGYLDSLIEFVDLRREAGSTDKEIFEDMQKESLRRAKEEAKKK